MPTWLAVAVTAALFPLSTLPAARLGPGWRAWPRADRVGYAALSAAVWPWLLVGYLTTPPAWYTAIAGTVAAASLAAFTVRQARWLRQSRATLARIQEKAGQPRRHRGGAA